MKRTLLGDIATISSGGTPDRGTPEYWAGSIPWVKTGEIQFNVIRDTEEKITARALKESSAKMVPSGSLLMAMYGQGKTRGQVALLGIEAAINQACAAITPHDFSDSRYLFQYLAANYHNVRRLSNSGSQENLNAELIRGIRIFYPEKPQRGRIADILSSWDSALDKLDALIAAKVSRKKGLVQHLFSGGHRLPGFDHSKDREIKDRFGFFPADWKRTQLGAVTVESSVRADTVADGTVLSSTKHRGLVPSEEYFGKRVYAADTSNYKVVRRGEFAYATNHIEEGSIGYQADFDIGLVSPIYTVFRTNGRTDDRYLFRLLKSPLLLHLYQINTSASVDRRGSLRYGEFAKMHVWLPPKDEQTAIANILADADTELRLLHDQRAALDQQKRGLMQQLLTGKVRVKP